MGLTRQDITTITPLRFIFWGGLICVLDITVTQTVNGEGFKFDFVNDVVGTILIAVGVFRLASIRVHPRYANAMWFVQLIAVFAIFEAFHDHFIYDVPEIISFLLGVFGLATMVAIVLFLVSMRWLCAEAGLEASRGSWSTTLTLFIVIYVVPLGLLYIAGLVAMATGKSFHINLGPAGLLLVPVFFVPLIHLFVSTSRMMREAEQSQGEVAPSVVE